MPTGDLGYTDDNGLLFVVDRLKDIIIRAGENISASEVESCLLQHPAVLAAAVFGVSDEQTGEAVIASVQLAQTVEAAELQAFVGQHLAAYKVPKHIQTQFHSLPTNPAGKVLKKQLQQAFIEGVNT